MRTNLAPYLTAIGNRIFEIIESATRIKTKTETKTKNEVIKDAILHSIKAGGKRLRASFIVMSHLLVYEEDVDLETSIHTIDNLISYSACVELLHSASLIIDDIVDSSDMRRGVKSVNAQWGNKIAVITGSFILSALSYELAKIGNTEVIKRFSNTAKIMSEGEATEITLSHNPDATIEDYLEIVKSKTAELFSLCCSIPSILKKDEKNVDIMGKIGLDIGIAFQIKDDILDFESDSSLGKPLLKDVKEGKVTIPLILSLKKKSSDDIKNIFSNSQNISEKDIEFICNFVKETGGLESAYKLANEYISKVERAVSINFKNSRFKNDFLELVNFTIGRIN